MHIHNNYSLASLEAGQTTAHEIAAQRSAEVRKKLSMAAAGLNDSGDEILGVRAQGDEPKHGQKQRDPGDNEFGQLFSARV